jgi:hypothetical protein
MNRRMRIVFGLAALLAIDFAMTTVFLWLVENRSLGGNWAGFFGMGLLFGQVLVLGLWLALGDAKWYWRLAGSAFATMLLAQSITLTSRFSRDGFTEDENPAAWPTLVLLVALLLVHMVLWPMRQVGSWRLTWGRYESTATTISQFRTGDLLLWMAVIGGVLAALRFMTSVIGDSGGLFKFILQVLGMVLLTVVAMLTAFARQRVVRHFVLLIVLALLIGGSLAAFEAWERFQVAQPTVRWQTRLWFACWEASAESFTFVGTTLVSLLNCLALRALGCSFARPANSISTGAKSPVSLEPA